MLATGRRTESISMDDNTNPNMRKIIFFQSPLKQEIVTGFLKECTDAYSGFLFLGTTTVSFPISTPEKFYRMKFVFLGKPT